MAQKIVCILTGGTLLLAGSVAARAASVGTQVVNADNLDVSLDVTEQANAFTFSFQNNSDVPSSITKLWFENGLFGNGGVLSGVSRTPSQSGGVTMIDHSADVANTPGLLGGTDWQGTQVAYLARYLAPAAGINNNGDRFSVRFQKTDSTTTLSDLTDTILKTTSSRVGMLIQTLSGRRSRFGFITGRPATPTGGGSGGAGGGGPVPLVGRLQANADPPHAPTPMALSAGAALLAGLVLRRRR